MEYLGRGVGSLLAGSGMVVAKLRWIRDPQDILPGNAMPNTRVGEAEARDLAAYLYTLR